MGVIGGAEGALGERGADFGQIQAAGEVLTVREQHPAAQPVVARAVQRLAPPA